MVKCNSEIKDCACFRGATKSVLADSNLDSQKKSSILDVIDNKTKGNITSIFPQSNNPNEDFKQVFNNFLKDFTVYCYKTPSALFQVLNSGLINQYDFCLLFWEGTPNGQNRHVTRFCDLQGKDLVLMDPAKGKSLTFSIQRLQQLSPQGFSLVLFSFK